MGQGPTENAEGWGLLKRAGFFSFQFLFFFFLFSFFNPDLNLGWLLLHREREAASPNLFRFVFLS